MVKRPGFELSLVIKALDQGWQIDEKGQLLLSNDTRNVYVRMLTRTAEKIAELEEQLKEQEPVRVGKKIKAGDVVLDFYQCGHCKNAIRQPWRYCPFCGKAVKWDA